MTISRAQMGTQLKGNRAMKKMKKYANGNMIDPNTPGVANSLRPKMRPGGVPEGEPSSVGPSGGTRGTPEDAARLVAERKRRQREAALEEKRRRASKSPGMNKRLNASGATGAKGSDRGAAMSAEMMAQDPARGGVDPANERAKSMLSGMADMKKGGKVKKMMGGGGVSGLYGKGAMEKELEAKKMMGGGMKKGGKVRGAGCAKRGIRKAKMR